MVERSWITRREITIGIGSLAIIISLAAYFLKIVLLQEISVELQNWTVILSSFALGVGAISILMINLRHIVDRTSNAPYSLTLIVGFLLMTITGLFLGSIASHPYYSWVYVNMYTPLKTTMSTFCAFYIFTAAVRAFRARSFESGLMLTAAILVLFGNMPMSSSIWVGFEPIRAWIMNVMNAAGYRGIVIGAGVALLMMGIRVILGIERGFYGGEK